MNQPVLVLVNAFDRLQLPCGYSMLVRLGASGDTRLHVFSSTPARPRLEGPVQFHIISEGFIAGP